MEIVEQSHPDLTALQIHSQYYDPKSTTENPRWFMVSVKFLKKFKQIISLSELKQSPTLENMVILKPGKRLSITPVSEKEWQFILTLTEKA